MNAGKTLVLAGAREAHGMIIGLVSRGRNVIASLPEPERGMEPLPVPTRLGPFSERETLEDWAQAQNVVTVLDASHPFDDHISNQASQYCRRNGLRYLRVLRSSWRPTSQDQWTACATTRAAVEAVPIGARVFSNTGWASLPDYATFAGQIVYLRQTRLPSAPPPWPHVRFLEGKPPFSQREEQQLFESLRITRLISRNVGGIASMSKLLAARQLGIRVLMVERPPAPPGSRVVESVAEALAWEADA
nr:precorrin-6A/cobalt-precorrin-6A reductase [uncultured Roseobacter sp.]